ncbi:MAG: VPLPA-CTERM sorting domain-containing protein [Tateyamaria sp.]|uniref:VPLPA-CTERM sorting domain-containing protein n=1 Tax=Tateyamaria sp. TaxID=1929288 RepID=UPI00327F12B2
MKYFAIAAAFALTLPSLAGAATMDTVFGKALVGNDANSQVNTSDMPTPGTSDSAGINAIKTASNGGDANVIGYYIPLLGSCDFGVGNCGFTADRGLGGSLTMWLLFEDVKAGDATANFFFEDLDLIGANDPVGFTESVTLFDTKGGSVAVTNADPVASTVGSGPSVTVSGDASTQLALSMDLGRLEAGDHLLKLDFTSLVEEEFFTPARGRTSLERYNKCKDKLALGYLTTNYCPRNTPEFFIASIHTTPVPLPAAGWMLLAGVGGLAAMRRRKKAA